jgi:glycosyltransferase involved in cell wall biosynthesis
VHDLSFLRFPEAFRPFNRFYLSAVVRAAARSAARIIAVSESTRRDVMSYLNVPGDRVVAIPNGVTANFRPANEEEVTQFRMRKDLPERFVLFVGTLEPRKNLVRLIDAYARWRTSAGAGSAVKLIIGGAKGWFYDEVFQRVHEHRLDECVLFPGYIPADELAWWYRSAAVFVYPSTYEGFGLPVLEAMACGTPTITSTTSSLPEVAGDAAILVDPLNTEEIAQALAHVLADQDLSNHLRGAGLRRSAQFSWRRTATMTAGVYREALGRTV